MQVLLKWHLGGYRPADQNAEEMAAKMQPGQYVKAEIKRVRSPKQLRLWWAMIGLIHQHQSRYATREDLSDAFKIWLGHCEEITLRDGRAAVRAKSIAFGNMGQDEFNEFMNAATKLVCEHFIPGTDDIELRAELEAMIGTRTAA